MPSIPIPQIKMGKRKERSQMCKLITDDGRLVDRELKVDYGAMVDQAAGTLWQIDTEGQYMADDNVWYQILTEVSEYPVSTKAVDDPDYQKKMEKNSDVVYRLTFNQKQNEFFNQIKTDSQWGKMTLIISIVMGSMIIIAGMRYIPELVGR